MRAQTSSISPGLEAFAHMHRTSGGHRTIDVTRGLPPSTFRVPGRNPATPRTVLGSICVEKCAQDDTYQCGASRETATG